VRFWSSLWTILRSITPYFLLGMLIAGVLSALLPDDAIPRYLGGSTGVPAYELLDSSFFHLPARADPQARPHGSPVTLATML
jgi:hypothetical protein